MSKILKTDVAADVKIISVVLPLSNIPNSIAKIVKPLIKPEPANNGNKGRKTLTTNDMNLSNIPCFDSSNFKSSSINISTFFSELIFELSII